MELFLIRHAQSLNNALPEAQRVPDPSLSEVGRAQAARLGDWIGDLNLTRLFTSPFRRTLETTAAIYRSIDLVPEVRVGLHEQGGCYQGYPPGELIGQPGMNRAEIMNEFPGFEVESGLDGQGWWNRRPYESHEDARQRARELLQATQKEFGRTDERVAYVMHADIQHFFLSHVHPEDLGVARNASVTHLAISQTMTQLVEFSNVDHLPADLVTF